MPPRMKRSFDQLTMFSPPSPWVAPTELPDLSNESEVAIDTETRDNYLAKDKGPGFFAYERGNPNEGGLISGISVAWRDQAIYIPLQHIATKCFDLEMVQRWLMALAAQNRTRFIFHNFQYDWGWIQSVFGITPPVLLDDVAAMASMVDENLPSYTLDNLAKWQGLPGKDERILKEAISQFMNKFSESDIKENLWRLEGKYVGIYAEQDAVNTLKLAGKLRPLLSAENLDSAYQVERDLMPITLKMKLRGIRIDKQRAERLVSEIFNKTDKELKELGQKLGKYDLGMKHIRSNAFLKLAFEKLNLQYPRTAPSESYAEGQASFEKNFMSTHEHWFPKTVHRIKHQRDLAERFLQKFILKYEYKGRVYPSINQFRSETGGARSHRFSYSHPPLQQMPSRDDDYAAIIRSCFLPEEGENWCSIDYRQQEYRLIVFVSELLRARGAKRAADMYRYNPDTDFHNYVADITRLPRRRAKDVNFAKSYGAGVSKFALMTGMSEDEAHATMQQYDEELPFVREAAERYMSFATRNGYIKLIDGARNHFNLFEPTTRDFYAETMYKKHHHDTDTIPCHEEEALRRCHDSEHPWETPLKRAFTHKAFNRMIQGSAARQIKKAMIDIDRAGFNPLLQLHDELGFSLMNKEDAFECARYMENALPVITIPMSTDVKWGENWGYLEKITQK